MRFSYCRLVSLLFVALLLIIPCVVVLADSVVLPVEQRLSRAGVGLPPHLDIADYPVNDLRIGWYWNWTAPYSPSTPGGIDFWVRLDLEDGTGTPLLWGDALQSRVLAQPGAVWLVGNEPDCINQDALMPEVYAQSYHDVYYAIKAIDPTAIVCAGQIVQPTPVRLAYLDRVLAAYESQYGATLPTDAWGMHAYVLNEDPALGWGAWQPLGFSADDERLLAIPWDNNVLTADPDLLSDLVRDMRSWMAENGYRDVPLFVTEYGSLVPDDMFQRNGTSLSQAEGQALVLDYMSASWALFADGTDLTTGNTWDNDRLVQAWAWYALVDDTPFLNRMGSQLYAYETGVTTVYGERFASLAQAVDAEVNLRVAATTVPAAFSVTVGDTVTLDALIVNNGNIDSGGAASVSLYDGDPALGGTLLDEEALGVVTGNAIVRAVRLSFSSSDVGNHQLFVVVDRENVILETDEQDNQLVVTLNVNDPAAYTLVAPLIWR